MVRSSHRRLPTSISTRNEITSPDDSTKLPSSNKRTRTHRSEILLYHRNHYPIILPCGVHNTRDDGSSRRWWHPPPSKNEITSINLNETGSRIASSSSECGQGNQRENNKKEHSKKCETLFQLSRSNPATHNSGGPLLICDVRARCKFRSENGCFCMQFLLGLSSCFKVCCREL